MMMIRKMWNNNKLLCNQTRAYLQVCLCISLSLFFLALFSGLRFFISLSVFFRLILFILFVTFCFYLNKLIFAIFTMLYKNLEMSMYPHKRTHTLSIIHTYNTQLYTNAHTQFCTHTYMHVDPNSS